MEFGERARTLSERVGEEICHLRLGRGLTQTALGNIIGATQHQIQRYEAGQSSLSIERLASIACALDVQPGHFFGEGHALRNMTPADLGFGDAKIGLCSKDDLELAAKIARIRADGERRDILASIEQTVALLLRT